MIINTYKRRTKKVAIGPGSDVQKSIRQDLGLEREKVAANDMA